LGAQGLKRKNTDTKYIVEKNVEFEVGNSVSPSLSAFQGETEMVSQMTSWLSKRSLAISLGVDQQINPSLTTLLALHIFVCS